MPRENSCSSSAASLRPAAMLETLSRASPLSGGYSAAAARAANASDTSRCWVPSWRSVSSCVAPRRLRPRFWRGTRSTRSGRSRSDRRGDLLGEPFQTRLGVGAARAGARSRVRAIPSPPGTRRHSAEDRPVRREAANLLRRVRQRRPGCSSRPKGTVAREALRMAIGQLMDYRRFARDTIRPAVLVPEWPRLDSTASFKKCWRPRDLARRRSIRGGRAQRRRVTQHPGSAEHSACAKAAGTYCPQMRLEASDTHTRRGLHTHAAGVSTSRYRLRMGTLMVDGYRIEPLSMRTWVSVCGFGPAAQRCVGWLLVHVLPPPPGFRRGAQGARP